LNLSSAISVYRTVWEMFRWPSIPCGRHWVSTRNTWTAEGRFSLMTSALREAIIFRAAHPVVDSLAPYPAAERAAMLPNIVRVLLATLLEAVGGSS
jgi:hypothetical protein